MKTIIYFMLAVLLTSNMLFGINEFYPNPGIIAQRNGQWVGSDHLFNLSERIPVLVEILKPESLVLDVTLEKGASWVEEIFSRSNINTSVEFKLNTHLPPPVQPGTLSPLKDSKSITAQSSRALAEAADANLPALPFFHLLVMIYPFDKGVAIYCEGRLFESVNLKRIILPPGTFFQAITWENQSLTISAKEGLNEELKKSVQEIATSFGSRYTFFDKLRRSTTGSH